MQVFRRGEYELHVHNVLLINQYMGFDLPYGLYVGHKEIKYIEYTTSNGREMIAPLPIGTTEEQFESYLEQVKSRDSLVSIFREFSHEKLGASRELYKREFYQRNERKTFSLILSLYNKAVLTGDDGSQVGSVIKRRVPAGIITGGSIKTCKTRKSLEIDFIGVDFRTAPRLKIGSVKQATLELLNSNDQLLEQCYAFAITNGYSRDLLDTRLDDMEKDFKSRQLTNKETRRIIESSYRTDKPKLDDEGYLERQEARKKGNEERLKKRQELVEKRNSIITPLVHVEPPVKRPKENTRISNEENAKRVERGLPPMINASQSITPQEPKFNAQEQFEQQMEQRRREEAEPKKKGGLFRTLFRGADN